jgi:rhomboid protease GluP
VDGEAFVPVRYTASAEVLARWELTLQALGVPYQIVDLEETDGWSVRVPEPLAQKVREALRSAEADERAEQIEAAREREREALERRERHELRLSAWPAAAFVAGLAFFTAFAGLGDATKPTRWFAAGANVFAKTRAAEPWRAVTALTLHASVEHLALNAAAAMFMLPLACEFWGLGVGTALTVLAGALGNYVEAYFAGSAASLGASTALFAALGIAGGTRLLRQGTTVRDMFLIVVALLVMVGMFGLGRGAPDPLDVLFPGAVVPEAVDVLAHVLGFLLGGVLGAAARWRWRTRPGPGAQWAFAAATVLVLFSAWELALWHRPA